jgi:hypothetical protein
MDGNGSSLILKQMERNIFFSTIVGYSLDLYFSNFEIITIFDGSCSFIFFRKISLDL